MRAQDIYRGVLFLFLFLCCAVRSGSTRLSSLGAVNWAHVGRPGSDEKLSDERESQHRVLPIDTHHNKIYYEAASQQIMGPGKASDYGWQVLLNKDVLVVAGDTYQNSQGVVTVSTCEGITCTLRATLNNPNGQPSHFGQGLSSVGNFVAVGAPLDEGVGAVYIYSIADVASPTQVAKLFPESSMTKTRFGTALSLVQSAGDSSSLYLAVGDPDGGKVYFYSLGPSVGQSTLLTTVDGSGIAWPALPTWAQQQATNSYVELMSFGYPIVTSSNWVVTSSQQYQSIYVLTCVPDSSSSPTSATCSQVGSLITGPNAATENDYFGYMIAVEKQTTSDDGFDQGILVAGAFGTNKNEGAAYVYWFTARTNVWTLVRTLSPPFDSAPRMEDSTPYFGAGVALSAGTLAIAASGQNRRGAVYVYYYSSGGAVVSPLIQEIDCVDEGCKDSSYGNNAIALSGTATFLAIGGRYANGGYEFRDNNLFPLGSGEVWIYSTAPTSWPTSAPTTPTARPTLLPSPNPSFQPSARGHTNAPVTRPTAALSLKPSALPTTAAAAPVSKPTRAPTSQQPVAAPTAAPSSKQQPAPLPSQRPSSSSPTTFKPTSLRPTLAPQRSASSARSPAPSVASSASDAAQSVGSANGSSGSSSTNAAAWAVPLVFVLLCVGGALAYRRYRAGGGVFKSAYDEWHDWQAAKAEGKGKAYQGKRASVMNPAAALPASVLVPANTAPVAAASASGRGSSPGTGTAVAGGGAVTDEIPANFTGRSLSFSAAPMSYNPLLLANLAKAQAQPTPEAEEQSKDEDKDGDKEAQAKTAPALPAAVASARASVNVVPSPLTARRLSALPPSPPSAGSSP